MNYDYVRLKPSEQIGIHSQPGWELSYIIKGHGERTVGDTVSPFAEGDMVLVIPNMTHQWRFEDTGDEIENVTIHFDHNFVGEICARITGFVPVVKYLSGLQTSLEITGETRDEIAVEMVGMRDLSEASRAAVAIRILARLGENTESRPAGGFVSGSSAKDRLKEVEIYVKCNFGRHISTKEVARHVGMSESGFCAFWKRNTGSGFTAYLTSHRIGVACYLLEKRELSLSDIAYETGFADLPSFSKAFKRLKGLSPKQYRKRLR